MNITTGVPGSVIGMDTPRIPAFVNPLRSEPAERFSRTIDQIPAAASGGGGGGSADWPLKLVRVDSTHLKVLFGQVNGITPSAGWAGGGDDVGVSVDISGYANGTYNIYLALTVDGTTGVMSAATVVASTSAVPANTGTAAYMLIGQSVITSAVVVSVTPSLGWSQSFVACTGGDPTTYHWFAS